jgi:hypothetical protein
MVIESFQDITLSSKPFPSVPMKSSYLYLLPMPAERIISSYFLLSL